MSEPRIEHRPIEPDAAPPTPTARPADRLTIWGVSTVVIGVFLVLDFITPQLFDRFPINVWLETVLFGICIGQVNLIAVWAVLAPGNIVVRLPWSLLLTAAMWYALVLGNRVAGWDQPLYGALFQGILLFSGVVIAQVPLWIAKRVFRWRLVRGADGPVQVEQGPWQFNIRHLLLATFLLAVALSPLRRVLPPGPIDCLPFDGELLAVFGFGIPFNLLVTVPCIWGMMVSWRASVPLALGWLSYCGILTGAEIGSHGAIFGWLVGSEGHGARGFLVLLAMNLSQGATVFGTLLIYRALGFRLVRAAPAGKKHHGLNLPVSLETPQPAGVCRFLCQPRGQRGQSHSCGLVPQKSGQSPAGG
jgi:hypothetical protein